MSIGTSVEFSSSVMSYFLQPHGLQHARIPCPSPTPRAYSNSCPLSQWCHPTILCRPLLLPPSIIPSIGVFSNESVLRIKWPKYWSFSFNISPSNEYSGLSTTWQINGEKMETMTDFIFFVSKIIVDGGCSHEIKRHFILGRKAITNIDSTLKSGDITLPTKVHLVKVMVFPVVMYECESWTIKKPSAKELMLLNCGVGEDSWESLGLQGDSSSPFWRRSALGFLWKEWC